MAHSNLLDKLQEKNLLTVVDNKVGIKPHDKYNFTTYPLQDNDYILITDEEYIGLITHVYMFNEELDGVVDYEEPIIEEEPIEEENSNE